MLEHGAFHDVVVFALDTLQPRLSEHESNRGFGGDAMMPGDDPALGIEAGFDELRRGRAELAGFHIVLSAPDDLDRLAGHGLRDHDSVEADIGMAAPSIGA